MSSKKCISLENFDPDDLVFDYVKEGKMSDGTSFSKTPISVLRSDGTTGPHRNNRHRMRDDDESCLHFLTVRALLNAPY